MLRMLYRLLTVASAMAFVAVVALWARSEQHQDAVVLRVAPSYSGRPGVKWVVIRGGDGLHLSALVKVVPNVNDPSPPWRADVTLGTEAPAMNMDGMPVRVTALTAPRPTFGRAMTEAQRSEFDALVGPVYGSMRRLRWGSGILSPFRPTRARGHPLFERLGLWSFDRDYYHIDEEVFPGAYREWRIRVPYWLVLTVATALPLSLMPRWIRGRRARLRLLRRECPDCGFDMRSSWARCPECGRQVGRVEKERARRPVLRRWAAGMAGSRPWRRVLIAAAAAVAFGASFLWLCAGADPASVTHEARARRRELDARLAAVAREVERLRAAGDAAGAERLRAEVEPLVRRAAGIRPDPQDEPQLHVVSLNNPYSAGPFRPVVDVKVTATDRPVVLALCGSDMFTWDLRVAPGVRLRRILLGGQGPQNVLNLPPGVPVGNGVAAGGYHGTYCPVSEGPIAAWETELSIGRTAGVPVSTIQVRDHYNGPPIVVGPGNVDWEVQRVLTDLRSVYARATAFERGRALEAVRSLRFTAVWRQEDEGTLYRGNWFIAPGRLAVFDVTGPIGSRFPRIPTVGADLSIGSGRDLGDATWFSIGSGGVLWHDGRNGRFHHTLLFGTAGLSDRAAVAFDSRRRRFLLCEGDDTPTFCHVYRYDLDANALKLAYRTNQTAGYTAAVYSHHDDCFYAVGRAIAREGAMVLTIVRLTPEGIPQWQIPVGEYVTNLNMTAQIAAAGRYVILLTAPLPDPLDPAAPVKPRCVVIEPGENRVVYSGAMDVHGGREDRR